MTSSNGNNITAPRYWPFCGEFTGHRWIPYTKASDAELWYFLWSASSKRLSKQSWGWWFETPSHLLWRHSNESLEAGRSVVSVNVVTTVWGNGLTAIFYIWLVAWRNQAITWTNVWRSSDKQQGQLTRKSLRLTWVNFLSKIDDEYSNGRPRTIATHIRQ